MATKSNRFLPLILVALAAWFVFEYFFKPPPQREVAGTGDTPVAEPQAPIEAQPKLPPAPEVQETVTELVRAKPREPGQGLTVDNIDLGQELDALFRVSVETLSTISDLDSARGAVAELKKVAQAVDIVGNLAAKLPPEGRRALTDIIVASGPDLDKSIAAAYAIPGVGNIIDESVDNLIKKLTTLAQG